MKKTSLTLAMRRASWNATCTRVLIVSSSDKTQKVYIRTRDFSKLVLHYPSSDSAFCPANNVFTRAYVCFLINLFLTINTQRFVHPTAVVLKENHKGEERWHRNFFFLSRLIVTQPQFFKKVNNVRNKLERFISIHTRICLLKIWKII